MRASFVSRIPSLWGMYKDGPLGSGRHGLKRSAATLDKPLTVEQQRRLDSIMMKCEAIRYKVQNKGQAHWWVMRSYEPCAWGPPGRCSCLVMPCRFKSPVDLTLFPTYMNYVSYPMDLGTIKNKIAKKAYANPLEFKSDMDLVWENCAKYNAEKTPARNDGDNCKASWLKFWGESGIEAEWKALAVEIDPSVSATTMATFGLRWPLMKCS